MTDFLMLPLAVLPFPDIDPVIVQIGPLAIHWYGVGYVIGRKAMPRAVDRNRLRRRMREHVRAARPAVERFDIILRVRGRVDRDNLAAAAAEARALLAGLTGDAG